MLFTLFHIVAYCMIIQAGEASGDRQSPRAGTTLDVDIQGRIYLLDRENHSLVLLSREEEQLAQVGGAGWENTQFDSPRSVWARNGIDVFVADYGNHRIQRFDRNLNYVSTLHTRESQVAGEQFGYPTGVALSRMGDLFVCDGENSRLLKYSAQNRLERIIGGIDAGRGRLTNPLDVEIGSGDRIYVQDGGRIVVYDPFGNFVQELVGDIARNALLHADARGVIVVSDGMIISFDSADRPVATSALENILGYSPAIISGIAASGDTLYVLHGRGIHRITDPRNELILKK